MKVVWFALLIAMVPSLGHAQQTRIPDEAVRQLSKDLADLNREVLRAQQVLQASSGVFRYPLKATVTRKSVPVRLGASEIAKISFNAKEGETYGVLDKVGDWYAIQSQDQAGWVNASGVKVVLLSGGKIFPALEHAMAMVVPEERLMERIFRSLTESATKLREKYAQNPYFFVKGFSVNLGITPSVQLTFEFKQAK